MTQIITLLSLLVSPSSIRSAARSAGAAQQLPGQAPGWRTIMEHIPAGISSRLGQQVRPQQQ